MGVTGIAGKSTASFIISAATIVRSSNVPTTIKPRWATFAYSKSVKVEVSSDKNPNSNVINHKYVCKKIQFFLLTCKILSHMLLSLLLNAYWYFRIQTNCCCWTQTNCCFRYQFRCSSKQNFHIENCIVNSSNLMSILLERLWELNSLFGFENCRSQ